MLDKHIRVCVFLRAVIGYEMPISPPYLCAFQSSELDDILNDLQNAQPQLFCEPRPVSLPSPMDKQNIINDILQMSENNPALAAQQQHRSIAAGMGPTSEYHTYWNVTYHLRIIPLSITLSGYFIEIVAFG